MLTDFRQHQKSVAGIPATSDNTSSELRQHIFSVAGVPTTCCRSSDNIRQHVVGCCRDSDDMLLDVVGIPTTCCRMLSECCRNVAREPRKRSRTQSSGKGRPGNLAKQLLRTQPNPDGIHSRIPTPPRHVPRQRAQQKQTELWQHPGIIPIEFQPHSGIIWNFN